MTSANVPYTKPEVPYTVAEVARLLRTHRYTIYKLLRDGRLGGFRLSNQWRIPVSELEKFMSVSYTEEGDS